MTPSPSDDVALPPIEPLKEFEARVGPGFPIADTPSINGRSSADHDRAKLRQTGPLPKLEPRSPATERGSPPARGWIIHDWIPGGVVTGLYGDGGLGKSLLAQQLQTACALGAPWLGLPCDRAPTLGIYCEDELGELRRRQVDINASYQCESDALGDLHWLPRLGEQNLLMTFRGGSGELTPFHAQLLACARKVMARVVIIDTAADAFGGNENDRGHVRQFVQHALGSIAKAIDGAVLLCAHPSRAGLASGEGDGGSTGWSNALRSRLFLRSPPDEDGAPADANARILQRRKSNYATRQDEIRLRWRDGVIEPEAVAVAASQRGRRSPDDVFLDLLAAVAGDGRPLSAVRNAGNFAPTVFAARPDREGYRKPDFVGAMERLFARNAIATVEYGRKGDERRKIVRASDKTDTATIPGPDFISSMDVENEIPF